MNLNVWGDFQICINVPLMIAYTVGYVLLAMHCPVLLQLEDTEIYHNITWFHNTRKAYITDIHLWLNI